MSEYIITDEQIAENQRLHGKKLLVMPVIVRCRDCDHGLFNGKTCDRLDPGFDEYWFEVEPGGFCAWGERRDA